MKPHLYSLCAAMLLVLCAAPAAAQDEEGVGEPTPAPAEVPADAADEFDELEAELEEEPPPSGDAVFVGPSNATDESTSEFDEVEAFMGIEQRTGTWALDDGLGADDVEWDDYDRETSYLPRGLVHFGIGGRVAAMPGGGDGLPAPDGPMVELSFLADFRYSQTKPWRMRLALAINYQPYAEVNVGAGARVAQSPFAIRLRILPLSFDIGRWVGIRVGPDIGIQWAPGSGGDGGSMTFLAGTTAEIVLNLMDGLFEVGLVGGMQLTAVGRSTRDGFGTDLRPEGMVGATAGYFFE